MEKTTTRFCKSKNCAEVITIGIGNVGVESVVHFVKEAAIEHKIINGSNLQLTPENYTYIDFSNSFFYEKQNGSHTARSILVENNNPLIDSVNSGTYGTIFNKSNNINFTYNSSHRYSTFYEHNKDYDQILEQIRSESEKCDNLEGFIINTNMQGGAAGISAKVSERLSVDYGKRAKIGNIMADSQIPSEYETYGAYNAVLFTHCALEHLDLVNFFDKPMLAKFWKANMGHCLNSSGFKIECQVIGKILNDITSTMRFTSSDSMSLNKLTRNFTNYPRILFSNVNFGYQDDEIESFSQAFNPSSSLSGIDISKGKFLSGLSIFRGPIKVSRLDEVIIKNMTSRKINSVDFNPQFPYTRSQCLISDSYGYISSILLSGNTNVLDIYSSPLVLFDKFYSEKKLVKDFVNDGMEEGEISEAREDIAALLMDYQEVGIDSYCEKEE